MENMSHPFGNNVGILFNSRCQALTRKILACVLPNAVSPDSGRLITASRARSWWVEPVIIRFIHARKGQEKGIQTPYQLVPTRPKLEENLENFMKLNSWGFFLIIIIYKMTKDIPLFKNFDLISIGKTEYVFCPYKAGVIFFQE